MVRQSQGASMPMEKVREMIRLHELGRNQTEIARSCGVARSTVQDYLRRATAKGVQYAEIAQLSDRDLQALLGKGKRSTPTASDSIAFEVIHRELSGKGVTLSLLWQEGIERGEWNCSYGGFCRRYNKWKASHKLSMRQTYESGEKLFVDYAGMTVPVTDPATGKSNQAEIFVGCLAASNYTFAEAIESQALPHWIGSHQRMLGFYGGVPKAIIPDNLKSGVTDACRYEPGVNRTYTEFAHHYGVAIIPARPYTPRDKAKVEKAVQEVERQILAPLRHMQFTSMAQLNGAIRDRLKILNERVMQHYGLSRRALFERTDQPALSPLPVHPFVVAQWKTAKVSPDYHIQVDYHYYSVPYWYVSRRVNVKITETMVEVFYEHQRIASHPRSQVRYRHSTVDEHMPPKHWEHQRQSRERFVAWAEHVGPHTKRQVEAIFESRAHDEQAFRSIKGIQRLASQYGCERLEAACYRANTFGMTGLRRLKSILNAQLDELPLSTPSSPPGPSHVNVRGQSYYQ